MPVVNGTAASETLDGSAGDDTINGLGGNDTLRGLAGNDSMDGGTGSDQYTGNEGNDTFNGGIDSDNDIVFYRQETGTGGVFANLTGSSVTINALTQAANTARDTHGNTDTFININGVEGSVGNDTLVGGSEDNWFRGMEGNDTINGGGGFDEMTFQPVLGAGQVPPSGITVTFSGNGNGTVNNDGFGGVDTFTSIERIRGTMLADSVTGDASDNTFRGLSGNDTFNAGAGYDTIDYTADETVVYLTSTGVTVNLGTGTAIDGFGSTDTFTSVEAVRGTRFADSLTGSNRTDETEQFRGLQGNDTINGAGGFDEVRYDNDAAFGGAAAVNVNLFTGVAIDGFGTTDTLSNIEGIRGTSQGDTFIGNQFDNDFRGLAGNDTITAGGGFDVLRYDSDQGNGGAAGVNVTFTGIGSGTAIDGFGATDTFSEIEGVRGTAFADTVTGAGGGEEFFGLAGADSFNGGAGFDTIRYDRDAQYGGVAGVTVNLAVGTAIDGFGNTDTLTGVEGARGTASGDTFIGDANANTFVGGAGNDTFDGTAGFDAVNYFSEGGTGGIVANLAFGTVTDTFGNADSVNNIEEIRGANAADSIRGAGQSESLFGNGGNDTLIGGAGRDFMSGGAGNDIIDGSSTVDQIAGDQDTAAYNNSGTTQGAIVNLDTGTATDGFGNTDTLIDIERVRGTNFADVVTGSSTANLRQERFEGLGGNDTIDGQAGWNVVSHQSDASNGGLAGVTVDLATGTATDGFGNTDTLINIGGVLGTAFADNMTGNSGNNIFRTNGGADTISGGAGLDSIELYINDMIGGAGVSIDLNTGTGVGLDAATFSFTGIEAVDGSFRNDTILGSNSTAAGLGDNLFGDLGDDSIDGRDGNDTISGGTGADTLIGGAGTDWLSYIFDTSLPFSYSPDDVTNQLNGWQAQNWNWTGVTINLATGVMSGFDGAVDTFSGFENVAGTYYDDNLTGDGNDNTFRGYAGNDTFNGGAGNDTVTYAPVYSRTSGIALALFIGDVPNGVSVSLGAGTAQDGNGGTDTLVSIENVIGSIGNDTITGTLGNAANVFTGGLGNDLYRLVGAEDTVVELANEGNDTIEAMVGTVTMGANIETLFFNGYNGNTNVLANDSDNLIFGTAGQNVFIGLGGNDTMYGIGLADVLDGGTGADSMFGGDGSDVYYVDNAADVVTENNAVVAVGGFDTIYASQNYTLSANVEQLVMTVFCATSTGNSGDNTLNATLRGGGVTMFGLGGNDAFYGSNYADSINGGEGNDIIQAFYSVGGVDTLVGGNGDDIYYLYETGDTIIEDIGGGLDTVYTDSNAVLFDNIEQIVFYGTATNITGNGSNNNLFGNNSLNSLTLDGGAGDDWLIGSNQSDTMFGGADNDILQGLGGSNQMSGGTGDDQYFSISSGDVITEDVGAGRDTLYSDYNISVLADNVEQLLSYGGATVGNGNGLDNTLYGNNNINGMMLDGGAGVDLIFDTGYNDTIVGGFGNDVMVEIGGNDRFAYTAAGNMGADLIIGFDSNPAGGQDLIDLVGRGYVSADIGTAITLANSGGSTLITFVSGSLQDTTITLSGVTVASVTATDFLFV
jgi:Ca2+-binding RTX toxin-like protein